MAKLRVLIFPYYKELTIPVEKKIGNRIILIISKLKQNWKSIHIDFPDVGYRGMEFCFNDLNNILVYEENIIFNCNSIIKFLHDPQKKVNNLLIKLASKEYYDELKYFFEVQRNRICNIEFEIEKKK